MEMTKNIGDGVSITIVGAAVIGYLPAVAAVLSILWTAIRIYETKTVQQIVQRIRARF